MATKDKSRTELAEKIAKQADLSINAVLRVFYALSEFGIDVTSIEATPPAAEETPSSPSKRRRKFKSPTVPIGSADS